MTRVRYITVEADDDGQRLDRWLKKNLPGVPLGLLQKLMRKGQMRVDSKRVKASTRLETGQSVRIPPMDPLKDDKTKKVVGSRDAELIRSLVIYDDGYLVAINKPAGIASQGGTGIKRNIDDMSAALINEDGVKPRLVHRLDKDTSGVLLMARSSQLARDMGKIFQGRDIKKIYWAICVPAPEISNGEIRAPIRKAGPVGKEKMIVDIEEGSPSITLFDVVERAHKQVAFVAFWPRTGRMHQIRAHAAHMGNPILCDGKYGGHEAFVDGLDVEERVHLHARSISFVHPRTNKTIEIEAPLAEDIKKTWKTLGFDTNPDYIPFNDIKKFKK